MGALPTAPSWAVARLIEALTASIVTDADRAEARAAILDALPTSRPWAVYSLVRAVRSPSHVNEWLDWMVDGPDPAD